MKVQCVIGARPNFMKMAPLIKILDNSGQFNTQIVHTGQHYDRRLSDNVWQDLNVRQPDVNLAVGGGSHAVQTANIMVSFEPVLLDSRPDLVIVAGDVNSTFACALTAAKLQVRVAHIEAGLRSRDWTMPEEINRVLTDKVSSYLFTPSRDADENLRQEGIDSEKIHFVGNLMVDSLLECLPRVRNDSKCSQALGLSPQEYMLVTLHRPAAVDNKAKLGELVDILRECAERLPVVFPAHPRTLNRLREFDLLDYLAEPSGLHIIDPLGYIDFVSLMQTARLVLTDSGGVQEETTILGVPCLTARENTERPITISEGTNRLVGMDRSGILKAVDECLDSPCPGPRTPEGWDGKAAERVFAVLKSLI